MKYNSELIKQVRTKAGKWLSPIYDEDTRKEVQRLLDKENPDELIDSFYKDLEFGTGGLRGIMGVGSNRMNIYTVGAATQGLSNYLRRNFIDLEQIKVAIGHDCRNNSRLFAESSAKIFAANGIKVYLFDGMRPTPELSFAIRELDCQSGIVITASHNPKEYNGYKVYWDDGSQIVAPHDINIVNEVRKISPEDIKFQGSDELIEIIGEEIDNKFLEKVGTVSISPDIVAKHKDIKIIYTPIHGTGVELIPAALRKFGFTHIINIPEQDVVNGDFSTVVSPNPEEEAAMEMALKKAYETEADVVMASDPDGDRIGVAVKNDKGKYIIINGNQTTLLFIYYIITRMKDTGALKGNEFIVKTIVTTEMVTAVAEKNNVECFDVYTGFKFIAEVIRELEGKKKYIGGGEESFGFLPADFVRDKDAVSSCALMAEITAWAIDQGKSLYELLRDIYLEYGYSKEKMKYVVRKGKAGADEIQKMMNDFRNNPPESLGGSTLERIKDYSALIEKNLITGKEEKIEQKVTANVVQFFTVDGSKISVRPSGTEPKIKFYFEVKEDLDSGDHFDDAEKKANAKIETIIRQLGL